MSKRSSFQNWIERANTDPHWRLLPLTHLSQSLTAERIISEGKINVEKCKNFKVPLAYFFYGRPAYRATSDASIQLEASSPFCFIFSPQIITKANRIFAFDTGAFHARMFKHVLDEQFVVEDFQLAEDPEQINRLISSAFADLDAYLYADRSRLNDPEAMAQPWEMVGKAYLTLLGSPGRNEPDDRICTVEVAFSEPVLLERNLECVIVPHTFWNGEKRAPFLVDLTERGVEVRPYRFIPGRTPEYFQTMIEGEMMSYLAQRGYLG
jgi:hypothetical protein